MITFIMIKQQAFEHFLKEEGIDEETGELSEGRQTQIYLDLKDCENIVDLLHVVDNNFRDPRDFYKAIITDIVNASTIKQQQYFPDDSTVLLSMDRLIADYNEFSEDDQDIIDQQCIRAQGEDADDPLILKVRVLCLATYTELGDPDFEYYDIQFEDGYVINGLSGSYLENLE